MPPVPALDCESVLVGAGAPPLPPTLVSLGLGPELVFEAAALLVAGVLLWGALLTAGIVPLLVAVAVLLGTGVVVLVGVGTPELVDVGEVPELGVPVTLPPLVD
jgi:hypothetical protein